MSFPISFTLAINAHKALPLTPVPSVQNSKHNLVFIHEAVKTRESVLESSCLTIATTTPNATSGCTAMKAVDVLERRRLARDALRMKPVVGKACVFSRLHFQHMEHARRSYHSLKICWSCPCIRQIWQR
jgi:hypothetical protein